MRVTFHGVRGSIPTPGPTTVRYGGNTVCVEIRTADGTLIICDAGTGLRPFGNELVRAPLPKTIHLLITHSHWDHIMGAPFFAPIWRKDAHILFHPFTKLAQERFARRVLFDGEHFPVKADDVPARVEQAPIATHARAGSATITRIALNHPGGADGYRIDDADGASLCYLTDNELSPPGPVTTSPAELARFAQGAQLVIHDAQYLPSDLPAKHGWGHSLVDDALALGRAAECRELALFHHEPERDDLALDEIGVHASNWAGVHAPAMKTTVAYEGLTLSLPPR